MTPEGMSKLFLGPRIKCSDTTEDAGLSYNRPDTQVSNPIPGHAIRIFIIKLPLKELSFKHEWIAEARLIRCPATLPETMPDPVLTRMREIAPFEEGEEGNKEATTSAKEAVRKGGIENSSIQGKKRNASEDPEAIASKRGKRPLSEGPAPESAPAALRPQGDQLPTKP